nr:single-stranded DNA-binding protein [Spirochaetaceae bacterium]
MNNVSLIGRLVRDAELKFTNGGNAICEFSLAVNERKKQGDQWVDVANYFDVTLFGRRGEALQQYLGKGKQVGVDGRLQQQRWQTSEGQNRSKVVIIARDVDLLGGREEGQKPQMHDTRVPKPVNDQPELEDDFRDGIPF